MDHLKIMAVAMSILLFLPLAFSKEVIWEEYGDNPVFGEWLDGPKAYYPSVIYDSNEFSGHGTAAQYKMWYGTSGGQTALATSDDGITWTDQGVVMTDGYHATVEYYPAGFTGANNGSSPSNGTMYYRMWYWDYSTIYDVSAIGYAESPEGATWHNIQPLQNGTVPIVTGTWPDWNRGSYGPCDILYNPDALNTGDDPFDYTFVMYYDGTTGGVESIGLGYSSDGVVWNGYDGDGDGNADPVLSGTYDPGDWEYDFVSRATIIRNADNDFEMWYSGGVGAMNNGIGYATSSDGIHWTRDDENPLLHKDDGVSWRHTRTYCPMVISEENSYKMWFAGKGEGKYSIGYMTGSSPEDETDTETPHFIFAPEKLFGVEIMNIDSGGTFAVQDGKEVGRLTLEKGTHTLEIDVMNTGILDAHAASLRVDTPEGIEVKISPENVTIARFSSEIFTIQLQIGDSVDPREYTFAVRVEGNFVHDTYDLTVRVE